MRNWWSPFCKAASWRHDPSRGRRIDLCHSSARDMGPRNPVSFPSDSTTPCGMWTSLWNSMEPHRIRPICSLGLWSSLPLQPQFHRAHSATAPEASCQHPTPDNPFGFFPSSPSRAWQLYPRPPTHKASLSWHPDWPSRGSLSVNWDPAGGKSKLYWVMRL